LPKRLVNRSTISLAGGLLRCQIAGSMRLKLGLSFDNGPRHLDTRMHVQFPKHLPQMVVNGVR
jgi:hypothetical protein